MILGYDRVTFAEIDESAIVKNHTLEQQTESELQQINKTFD